MADRWRSLPEILTGRVVEDCADDGTLLLAATRRAALLGPPDAPAAAYPPPGGVSHVLVWVGGDTLLHPASVPVQAPGRAPTEPRDGRLVATRGPGSGS